jgi:hypothetical protein
MKTTSFRCVAVACGAVWLGFAPDEASAAIPASERAALIALYDSTNGAAWANRTNWLGASGTECTWYGVSCNASEDHVQRLRLGFNQLTGSIPPEIGDLSQLTYLSLYANLLSGSIPPEIGNLVQLTELWLDHNLLSGSIPPHVGNLTGLDRLLLHANLLSGSIPPEIGNLAQLTELWLGGNRLSGSILPEIGNLIQLTKLSLDHNQLTGPIPPEIGRLTRLSWLYLNDNQLTGPIPPEIGKLTRLSFLYLNDNQLTGLIPRQVGSHPVLFRLILSSNHLSGPIPAAIGNLINLDYLDLGDNQLTGSIPPEIGSLRFLKYLRLQSNQLRGPVPATLANATSLTDGQSDLRWNALYTSDAALRAFLDSKQVGGDWEGTQTVTSVGLATGSATPDTVPLSWSPILYTGDTGGYRLWYGTQAGGPYNLGGTTADKTVSASAVSGLSPGTTYYFALDTSTEPHANNQNTVVSERSAEVSTTTMVGGMGWHGLTVARDGPGTVSSSPGGIGCGGGCAATFALGTPVTLTAVPDAGSAFLGWGGACAGTALTCDLTMDAAQTVTASFSTPALSYYTVAPCREYDSRDAGLGGPAALTANTDNAILVAGYCGIPATARAVSLNVTVVSPSASGHLRLYASGTPRSTASSINYASAQTRANNAVASLGADGALMVYVSQPSGTVHVFLDVNGYFQ